MSDTDLAARGGSDDLARPARSGFATWEIDRADVAHLSGRFMELLGRDAQAVSLAPEVWRGLIHAEDLAAAERARARLFSGRVATVAVTLNLRHVSGGDVAVTLCGQVTARDHDGMPTRIGGMAVAPDEIIEGATRRDAKAIALRETRDGIAITDAQGRYTFMNAAHRRMFGIAEAADVTRLHWSDLYAPEVVASIEAEVFPVLMRHGSSTGEARGRRLDDGTPVLQEVSLTLASGGGIICATWDIADRLRAEAERARLRERLRVAQRTEVVHALTAGAAHDLKNLLGLIQQRVSAIEAGVEDDPADAAGAITATVQEAVGLLDARLDFGKAGTESEEPIDLRAPLAKAIELVAATLPPGITHRLDLPETAVTLRAAQVDIVQVALNLLLNASDAVDPAKGRIVLTLDTVPGAGAGPPQVGALDPARRYARIAVRDNGPGIAPALQRTMFTPYVSGKGSAGTGLGMFVVAEVARGHGGAVCVSTQPGQGASVEVLLPID
ncbi:PAS domain-containing protein [Rhodosalinus sediminis]|uniref:histidine kinase n=1 Tax=Rhodosalinus sediminis TaxID=1940533 RepID=A0A3D9BWG9_9RHOB|nr:ATP-binding protein [Rhodosalinus sediminis]REC57691.1 PAS domain-containing protein [Rhodosalinus sediminis]